MTKKPSDAARDWKEGRRLRAWELSQEGWTQAAIAVALGVTEGAVSQPVLDGQSRVAEQSQARRHPCAA